ncbi:MAG TPA: long-chain fatty acid--CoA ligase, partial [Myxococcales bacterium]|nr:long-chain fatty acid--CoA ligase [Myxococcales bacterium]
MAAVNDWLRMRADLTPDRVALVDRAGRRGELTYARWNADVDRTARWMGEALGVSRGDRVAALAMNCVELLDLWFACGKLGAIFQPLNWRLTPVELQALVQDASASVLVFGKDFASQVEVLRSAATRLKRFVALDEEAARPGDAVLSSRDAVSGAPVRPAEVGEDDPWVLCYTGGTTGMPKGAVLTYRSILANAVNTIAGWGLGPEDSALLDAPLFHAGGLNVLTSPLVFAGGRSIVCRNFSADRVLEMVAGKRISVLFGVPTMFLAVQAHSGFSSVDFSPLKLVITGGAPCPPPVFEAFWARGVDFRMGYGLTEAGPNNFGMPKERVRQKLGSVGFPLPQVEIRIVSEGRDCQPGEVGEVLIRGPHVCGGYWRRPEETARAIVDGWLHTGDLGRVDEEGFHAIVGRQKELIISGGENVYPAEIEAVLAGHPAVAEAVVLGAPDPRWGEVPRAVVALKAQATADELTAFCLQRLGKYKVPRSF